MNDAIASLLAGASVAELSQDDITQVLGDLCQIAEMQGVDTSHHSERVLAQIGRSLVEIGNKTDFGALETDLLIGMIRMVMRQHLKQHDV